MTKEFTIKVNVPSGKVLTNVVEKTVMGETVFVPVFENKPMFKPGDFIYNPETQRGGIFAAVRKNVLYVYVYDPEMKTTVEDSAGKPSSWEHASAEAIAEYRKVLTRHNLSWDDVTLSYNVTNPSANTSSTRNANEAPYKNGEKYCAITPHGIHEYTWEGTMGDMMRTIIPDLHAKTREELVKRVVDHVTKL